MINIAKSSFKIPDIEAKLKLGAPGIEIQLLNRDIDGCLKPNFSIPTDFKSSPIVAVHAPLLTNYQGVDFLNCDIETVLGAEMFEKTCIFARKLSDFYGRKISVICHMELPLTVQEQVGIYDKTFETLRNMAESFSEIDINLENTTQRMYGVYDNVKLVKEINLSNVGTTFDVCHALISEYTTGLLTNNGAFKRGLDQTYEYMPLLTGLELNKDVCKWVHLNNATESEIGYGCGTGHGVPFDPENEKDIEFLKILIAKIKTFKNKADICIEVREDDYLNCINYAKTKAAFELAYKKQ